MKLGLSLIMNTLCTNNCRYCYQQIREHKIMSKDVVIQSINFLSNLGLFNNEIEFFGGEPMLSSNLINQIVLDLPDNRYSLITNGFFLNYDDYLKYVKNLKNVNITISLEINKEAHHYYRNKEDNYELMLSRAINLKKMGYNISINSSINYLIFENFNSTLSNIKKLNEYCIPIHFYSIKGNDGLNEIEQYEYIFSNLYTNNKKEIEYIFNINKDFLKTDIDFLCTFDNKVSVMPNGDILTCQWDNSFLGNIFKTSKEDFLKFYIERLTLNHKELYPGCSNCSVPVGVCNISCLPYIMNLLDTNPIELEQKCDIQKFIHQKRKELINYE